MSEYIVEQHYPDQATRCNMRSIAKTKALYQRIGYPTDIWKAQYAALVPSEPYFRESEGCMIFWNRGYENKFWYPTSQQLRDVFELDFTGEVCADDYSCYSKRLSFHWSKGTNLMVGDSVYESKGRLWAFKEALFGKD